MTHIAHSRTRVRGRHRVFLGYAPGVGKTYAMLVEARLRAARGEDVVVAYLQPHTRPDTRALMEGLEYIAPKRIAYRGTEFAEIDTEAVIARNPQWAVVDEVAHTNIPGAKHEKRWQSVEDILEAGIGVLSTLNVQHVQSRNDHVFQVAGVRITETVPDEVIEAADVVLVDCDPDELLSRVKQGSVVPRDEIGQALTHFFRKPTLVALREQAREIARRGARGASASEGRP